MGHGIYKVYPATIGAGNTDSSAIDLGRAYHHVYVYIPSINGACITATAGIGIKASPTGSDTYFPVYHPTVNTSTAETNLFSTVTTLSNAVVPIPNGFQYIKVSSTNTMTAALACQIIVADGT